MAGPALQAGPVGCKYGDLARKITTPSWAKPIAHYGGTGGMYSIAALARAAHALVRMRLLELISSFENFSFHSHGLSYGPLHFTV